MAIVRYYMHFNNFFIALLRNKEKYILLGSAQGILILHTLRYLNEIGNPADFVTKVPEPKENELSMATSLIKSMQGDFNIADFKYTYTNKLIKLIKAKASGKKLPVSKEVGRKPSDDLIA